MKVIQQLLVIIYGVCNKIGLLNNFWVKKSFYWAYFLYKQYFEDPFFGLTKKYPELFQGGHILDVGANIGYTATIFSKAISPKFKVYAFEPDETNFKSLQEIIQFNHSQKYIIPIQAAVGETEGTVKLWHNDTHHGDHRILTQEYQKKGADLTKVFSVPMVSIDGFVNTELRNTVIKFIKIDVQGYELSVCLGMQKTILENPEAVIVLEYMPTMIAEMGFNSGEILQFFQEKAYFMYSLDQQGNLVNTDYNLINTLLQQKGYIDLVFSLKKLV